MGLIAGLMLCAWRRIGTLAAVAQRGTCGGGPIFTGPVRLTQRVVLGKGRRTFDLSAVPTLVKALEDALQDAGIVADDRQVVELVVLAHGRDRGGPGWVELEIMEVTA